ncbi:TetR/AcrR family transcriptional regulator [Pseudonocardia sp. TRM90224]|uniref:TetR/AcrR family transcriptional regulator n=1 Tax=Pseudonocardia sp. TRM90224 TaxID=2812678 RepID=UPI001E4E1493|nr:TetR/AcrR family transcriptional regulator [Pseudonocardia sp. TRM90224]
MPRGSYRVKGSDAERTQARAQLRAELLGAARELAEAGGYDGVTVRQVAERVGYTTPVVYEYFGGKRALLLAVVDSGFADLADRLAAAGEGDLPAMADAWWEFATANPQLYQLMHSLPDVPFGTAETPEPARRCFQLLRTVARAADDETTDLLWAYLHGLTTLALKGRLKGGPGRARGLLDLLVADVSAR